MIARFAAGRQFMNDTSTTIPKQYQVYVMRLWQEQASPKESSSGWRFSIENPATGQRRGFSCLDELVAYLENLTTQESDS